MRIVSLCPSNTEIVCALGLGHLLVGVDDWSDDPEVVHLPRVGSDLFARIERVQALQPDLVLASLSVPGMERNVENLKNANLPHLVVESHDWQGVLRGIRQVADALGEPERGDALVARLEGRLKAVRRNVETARQLGRGPRAGARVYWEWWPKPLYVAGGPSWITDLLQEIGLRNAFVDVPKESAAIAPAAVVERDPDLICVCWCGTQQSKMSTARIRERDGWAQLRAVEDQRVYLLPENLFGRPGPKLVEGVELLADLLYGEPVTQKAAYQKALKVAGVAP